MSIVVTESPIQASSVHASINAVPVGANMSQLLNQWLTPSPKFEFVSAQSPKRAEVEKYVERQFESSYGAHLAEFLSVFLTLRCANKLSASAGISLGAESHKFFLEQYLDAPIEIELQRLSCEDISREKLAEIGNLVATSRGASRLMFIMLASVLNQAGYEWMVFTATKPLLHSLRKLGFASHLITEAKPSRLSKNSSANWGSYYENQPQVVAGRLSSAQQIVEGRNLFHMVQGFYRRKIESLALEINPQGRSNA